MHGLDFPRPLRDGGAPGDQSPARHSLLVLIHPFVGFWRRAGLRATFWFLAIFYIVSMAALFPVHKALLGCDLGTSLPLILAAVPLLVVSGVISRKRRRHLPFRTLAGVPEIDPEEQGIGLLCEGIYGRIRHPRYLEFMLALTGWTLFANYVGLYVIAAVSIALLLVIVVLEERELRKRYGAAYEEYSARVPRFIPGLEKREFPHRNFKFPHSRRELRGWMERLLVRKFKILAQEFTISVRKF